MKKEENEPLDVSDRISSIFLLLIIILGIFLLVIPNSLPQIIFRIILAGSALFASFLYFQRVKGLSVSSNTPVSDTIVILAGVYLSLILLLPAISDDSPTVFWSLGLIVLGILGRLILLDSLLSSLITTLYQLGNNFFNWLSNSFNLIRMILFFGGLILIVPRIFGIEFTFSILIGYVSISTSILLTMKNTQSPPFFLRFVGFLFSIFFLILGFSNISHPEVFVGYLILSGSIGLWIIGMEGLYWIYQALRSVFPFIKHFVITTTKQIGNYIRTNYIKILRFVSVVIGVILIILSLFSAGPNNGFLMGIGFILLPFIDKLIIFVQTSSIKLVHYINTHRRTSLQVFLLFMAPIAYFFLPSDQNLNIITTIFLVIGGIGPTILPPIWRSVSGIIIDILRWLKQTYEDHPVGTIQVTSLILALPAYFQVPSDITILDFGLNIIITFLLILLGIFPTVYTWFILMLPVFKETAEAVILLFVRIVKNPNSYYMILGGTSLYFGIILPSSMIIVKIISYFVFSLSISLLGNSFLMELYDSIIRSIHDFIIPAVKFIISLIRRILNFKFILSLLAWVMLIMGMFNIFIPPEYSLNGYTRWILIALSIVVWNSATPERRKQFKEVLNRITRGIFTRLVNFLTWIINNIVILFFILIGFGFFIISFGFITRSLNMINTLFSGVLPNRLVSWIIALFLIGIGIVTIQQALARRTALRLNGGNKE